MFSKTVYHVLIILLLSVGLASCSNKYKIEGKSEITSLDGKTLTLKLQKNGMLTTIDSAEVVHGYFKLSGKADSVCMATLFVGEQGIMPVVLESGRIKVLLTNQKLEASGTALNDALYQFIDKRDQLERQLADLDHQQAQMVMNGANFDEVNEQLTRKGNELVSEINRCVETFIKDNYDNVLAPTAFMMLCSNLSYPIMTDQIQRILSVAPPTFTNNEMVKDFVEKAKENMKLIQENQLLRQNVAENQMARQNMTQSTPSNKN